MVRDALGDPQLKRGDGRYWVYGWDEGRGKLIVVWRSQNVDDLGPLYSKEFALFFEFDERDVIRARGFGEAVTHAEDGSLREYCTAEGMCLEESRRFAFDESGLNIPYGTSPNAGSIVLSGAAARLLPMPTPEKDECLVIVWLHADDWNGVGGLAVATSSSRPGYLTWVPPRAFVAFVAPAGHRALTIRNAKLDSNESARQDAGLRTVQYGCNAGDTRYFEIAGAPHSQDRPSVVELRPVEATVARVAIEHMKRAVPPP